MGYAITERALVFGGDTMTATDIAVRLGMASVGDPSLVADISQDVAERAMAVMRAMVEDAIDVMKVSSDPIDVVLVGGGAIVLPLLFPVDPLAFACVIIRLDDTLTGRLGRVFETLRVNDTSGVPVWIQIRNHMIFLIRSGHLRPGDTLPTVRELAIQLGVNYNTIHKVYQDLETDGLILSGRGKRSTIAEIDREALSLPDSPVDVVIEELVRVIRETGVSRADAMARIEEAFAKLEDR